MLGLLFVAQFVCAQAAPITYKYSVLVGNIYSWQAGIGESLTAVEYLRGGQIRVGDTLTGTFTLDQDKLQLPSNMQQPTSRYFSNANGEGHDFNYVTPVGATFHSSGLPYSGSVQLEHSNYDLFAINSYDQEIVTGLLVANWNGGVFDSLNLPTNMNLADFDYTWFGTNWSMNDVQLDVRGIVNGLERVQDVNQVPEPSSWFLWMVGAFSLILVRRKSMA